MTRRSPDVWRSLFPQFIGKNINDLAVQFEIKPRNLREVVSSCGHGRYFIDNEGLVGLNKNQAPDHGNNISSFHHKKIILRPRIGPNYFEKFPNDHASDPISKHDVSTILTY